MNAIEQLKQEAALKAVEYLKSGMTIGLGTGSTAKYAIEALGQKLSSGGLERISAVPTSEATAELARRAQIPLVELSGSGVDIAIDGMDEITENLDAIKGNGGALTREKIVAARARTFILIGDERKQVQRLGANPVPVEVVPFGWRATLADLVSLGCEAIPRRQDSSAEAPFFISDNGNYILDCQFSRQFSPYAIAAEMLAIPGVVEHGLFLGMAKLAYIATHKGVLELSR